jgi:two-component system response regulator AlgR
MKVLIVDDEKPARDRLRQLLEDFDEYEVVAEAGNGEEAISLAAETTPDIVLLDIRMPGLDGIEAAHHLNKLESPPAIVFATAYDEYAIDAFDARAIGYVLKKHVCSTSHGQLKLIPVKDVYYFQADQKYVCVHHGGGQDLIDDSLKSLEEEFGDDFVRIHRGAVVAVDKIDRVAKSADGKHHVVMRDGSHEAENELIISRRHLADVRRRLKGG